MAEALHGLGRNEEADDAFSRSIADYRQSGALSPILANMLSAYGLMKMRVDDLPGAEAIHTEALEIYLQLLGPDHPSVGTSHSQLGWIRCRLGRRSEGIASYEAAISILERTVPETDVRLTDARVGPVRECGQA